MTVSSIQNEAQTQKNLKKVNRVPVSCETEKKWMEFFEM